MIFNIILYSVHRFDKEKRRKYVRIKNSADVIEIYFKGNFSDI